jgi:hypothetical protein
MMICTPTGRDECLSRIKEPPLLHSPHEHGGSHPNIVNVQRTDYYWNHHRYEHRDWDHRRWHYYD